MMSPAQQQHRSPLSIRRHRRGVGIFSSVWPPTPYREKIIRPSKKKKKEDHPVMEWGIWEEDIKSWFAAPEGKSDDDASDEVSLPAEALEAPKDVKLTLHGFQKEWLAWALKQENSLYLGGILADDTGLGKTIQAISFVLTVRSLPSRCESGTVLPKEEDFLPAVKCTLVICRDEIHWLHEIDTHTIDGTVKKLLFCSTDDFVDAGYSLHDYDFVITTYNMIESEYFASMVSLKDSDPKRAALRFKSVLYSVRWERIILDDAHFITFKISIIARAIFALHSIYKWALSSALQDDLEILKSLVRFIQIHPQAFWLCKDCNCEALDFCSTKYYTKISRKFGTESYTRYCTKCSHSSERHFSWWWACITHPVEHRRRKHATILLEKKLLSKILLRRTKLDLCRHQPNFEFLINVSLDGDERKFYEALYTRSHSQIGAYVEAESIYKNYGHSFDLLMHLRQAVDHPYLSVYSCSHYVSDEEDDDHPDCSFCHDHAEDLVLCHCGQYFCKGCLLEYQAIRGKWGCPTCERRPTADLTANCIYGGEKMAPSMKGCKGSRIKERIEEDGFKSSTKIDALIEKVREMIENDGSAKGVVFSQFTSFLDLIKISLEQSGIRCARFFERMIIPNQSPNKCMPINMFNNDPRAGIRCARFFERMIIPNQSPNKCMPINMFNNDPSCRILLMSLRASQQAVLNLTIASTVFLMEPWWNPAAEQHAQDHIYGISQHKPTRIVRFIAADTVEGRILELQTKKKGCSVSEMASLTEENLQFLFDL